MDLFTDRKHQARQAAATTFMVIRRPLALAVMMLLVLSASRALLVFTYWPRVEATAGLGFIFAQGIRFDIVLIGLLLGPLLVLKPWLHLGHGLGRPGAVLVSCWAALTLALAFFVEASTVPFVNEYDHRPNYLFVEYLAYPRELFATLMGTHALLLCLVTAIAAGLGVWVYRWMANDPQRSASLTLRACLYATPVLVLMVYLGVRSTLDRRPANPSTVAFSTDSLVNELPLNSPYTLLYALYEHRRDRLGRDIDYGALSEADTIRLMQHEARIDPAVIAQPERPTWRSQQATYKREQALNLVIIVLESLGAEHVGSLGGLDLTPELDALREEGIWFDQLYATGTRSARGIEAITTGFTPSPGLSVVKLAATQFNFFTLPRYLRQHGYATSFLYGGSAHFDNMRRFFLNNGVERVIEQRDFVDPVWTGRWGVSDEDLLDRAHQEFEAAQQPFFSLVFTTTHHTPFDVPAGRVQPIPGEEGKKFTTIRYVDHVLGEFINRARASDYWHNTLFLITSDHNSRVAGNQLVPIDRFHIPGVIVGGPVRARRIPGVSSQIDLVPTLISLLGLDGPLPTVGRDLTREEFFHGAGRAVMHFNRLMALVEGRRVVVLQPGLDPAQFLRASPGELVPDPDHDEELVRRALAYAKFAPLMIRRKAY